MDGVPGRPGAPVSVFFETCFFEIDFLSFRDPRDNPEIRENTDNLLDHNATLA